LFIFFILVFEHPKLDTGINHSGAKPFLFIIEI